MVYRLKNRSIAFAALALTALITLSLAAACGGESAVQIPPKTAVSPPPSAPVAPEPAPQADSAPITPKSATIEVADSETTDFKPNMLVIGYTRDITVPENDSEAQNVSGSLLANLVIREDLKSVGYMGDFEIIDSDEHHTYFIRTVDDIELLSMALKLNLLEDIEIAYLSRRTPGFIPMLCLKSSPPGYIKIWDCEETWAGAPNQKPPALSYNYTSENEEVCYHYLDINSHCISESATEIQPGFKALLNR